MEEYKPNSHKSKEEQKNLVPEKRVEKVISGTVKSVSYTHLTLPTT